MTKAWTGDAEADWGVADDVWESADSVEVMAEVMVEGVIGEEELIMERQKEEV